MSNFYLTELNTKKRSRSNDSRVLNQSGSLEIERNNSSDKIPKKESRAEMNTKFGHTKKEFLEFLISEETKFADLNRIEDFYDTNNLKYFNQYNLNTSRLERKREQLRQLEEQIQVEVLVHYKLREEDLLSFYEQQCNDLKEKIIRKEHDLECYIHMHQRLYKSNYLINKRYNEELKFEIISDKQFSKYKIINNTASLTVKQQNKFLNSMKMYNSICGSKFENDIINKKKKVNELEFQVFNIKSDTVKLQKKLDDILDNINHVSNVVKDIKNKNNQLVATNRKIRLNSLKTKIELNRIFKQFKAKSIPEIINKFNDQKLVYQSLHSQFCNLNKVLAELNIQFTTFKQQYDKIKAQIAHKYQEEKNTKLTDERIVKNEIILKESRGYNNSLEDKIISQEKLIKHIQKYLTYYDKKITDVINSAYNSMNIDSSKRPSRSSVELRGRELRKASIGSDTVDFEFNVQRANDFIKFFLSFGNKIMFTVTYICSKISHEIYTGNNPKNEISRILTNESMDQEGGENQSSMRFIIPEGPVLVFDIYNDNILTTLDEYIIQAMFRFEKKNHNFNKKEINIFKDRHNTTDISHPELVGGKKTTTINNIFHSFTGFLKKHGDFSKVTFLRNIQAQIIHHVHRYTNELVQTDKEERIAENMKVRQKAQEEKLKQYKVYKQLKDTTNLKKAKIMPPIPGKQFLFSSNKNSHRNAHLDDSYNSDNDLKHETKLNLLSANNNKHKNTNSALVYKRIDDLRNLELKYFKEGDKNKFNNEEFKETFYQFKKKYDLNANPFSKQVSLMSPHRKSLTNGFNKIPLIENELKSKRTHSINMRKEFLSDILNVNNEINATEKFINMKSRRTSSLTHGINSTGLSAIPYPQANLSPMRKLSDYDTLQRSRKSSGLDFKSTFYNEKKITNNLDYLKLPNLKNHNVKKYSFTKHYTNSIKELI